MVFYLSLLLAVDIFELDEIMSLTGISGAVAMNGQYIVLDGETIYKEEIPTSSVEKLLEAASPHSEALSFMTVKVIG